MQQDSNLYIHPFWQQAWDLAQLASEEPHPDDAPDMLKAKRIAADYTDSWADASAVDDQAKVDLIVQMLPQVSETVKALTRATEHQAAESHLQAEASADRAIAERDRAKAEATRAEADHQARENTGALVAAVREATKLAKDAWDSARKQEKLRAESDRKRAEAERQLAEAVQQHMPLFEEVAEHFIKPFIQGVAGSLGAQAGPIIRDHIQHQRLREDKEKEFQREQAKAQREHVERLATDPDYKKAQHDIWLYKTASGNNPESTRFERYTARMELSRRERAEREEKRDEERRRERIAEEEEIAAERKEQARQDHDERMFWTIDDATTRIQRTVEDTLEDTVENTVHRTLRDKLFQGPQGPQGPKGPPGRRAIIDVGPTPQASHNLTEEIEE